MGERKVLSKYIPPDFDPAKIPRRHAPKNHQKTVRMMLPMRLQCNTCDSYIHEGKKINSRIENVIGENYMHMQIYRFYMKCYKCYAEITFKTDPEHDGYAVEHGATERRVGHEVGDEEVQRDAMKSLEGRTRESKREMDGDSRLDELKSMKTRRGRVSVDAMFGALDSLYRPLVKEEERFEEEDEAVIKSIFGGAKRLIRRIDDGAFDDVDITKKVKLSKEVCDKPKEHVTKTTREGSRGRIDCKSSTVKILVKKKSS